MAKKSRQPAVMKHPVMKHTRVGGGGGIRPKGDSYSGSKGDVGKKAGRK